MRFIHAFVGQLDLKAAGFARAELPETSRPPYDPGDLLRLYLNGYLNRVRSSHGLEREAVRNLELISLLRKLGPTSRGSPFASRTARRSKRSVVTPPCSAAG